MPQSQPVRIPKASVVVAGRIRRAIVRGEYQVDQALPNETELMALYEVSRPVVREALRIIESESLIKVKRGARGGARVRRPDIAVAARHTASFLQLDGTTLEDLFEARALLEPAAVRRLATERPNDALKRLRRCHQDELAVIDDLVAYPVAAARFHEQVVELAGNRTMAILSRLLLEIVETQNRATFARLSGEGAKIARNAADCWHGPLIDMVEAGDVDGATSHWERHLQEAAQVSLSQLGHATVVDLLGRDD